MRCNSTLSDAEVIFSDKRSILSDERSILSDERSILSDGRTTHVAVCTWKWYIWSSCDWIQVLFLSSYQPISHVGLSVGCFFNFDATQERYQSRYVFLHTVLNRRACHV